jgi:hypothetical protein
MKVSGQRALDQRLTFAGKENGSRGNMAFPTVLKIAPVKTFGDLVLVRYCLPTYYARNGCKTNDLQDRKASNGDLEDQGVCPDGADDCFAVA